MSYTSSLITGENSSMDYIPPNSGLLTILDIGEWSCQRPLFLVSHKNRPLSPSQKSFVDFLQTHNHM